MSLTTQIWNWTDRGQFLLPKTHPPGVHQATIYECADGEWIHASTQAGITPTRSEASILGIDEVAYRRSSRWRQRSGPPTRSEAGRVQAPDVADELVEEYHAAGLGAEAIVAPHERFAHPQLSATGGVVEVEDPEVGNTHPTRRAHLTSRARPVRCRGRSPSPGAHTDEMLASLGRSRGRQSRSSGGGGSI